MNSQKNSSNTALNTRKLIGVVGGVIISIIILLLWSSDLAVNSSGTSTDMVDLQKYIPGIEVDLKYSSDDNVYGEAIYELQRAYLRRGTAEKLKAAQEELSARGLNLKVWDAYRPPAAQFKLWEIMPDRRFVVDPHEGFSYHSRGVAVDVTLIDEKGRELLMPSGFDEFSARADRDYSDVSSVQMDNAKLLEQIMLDNGFSSIYYEWWHFTDKKRDKYPVLQEDEYEFK
ncbi:d-alanyl-d-alanine dipeptidase [hydrocarbon metagenome]|uniref:D-alanyl-d-alanine dipeptidase n=1 Tax=hydrocarbon metagenome TaxID=938273 RepID=A0A0W8E8G3_9ZZZZ